MRSTAIDRRHALRLLAGSLAAPLWGAAAGAGKGRVRYLSAGVSAPGRYRVGGFSEAGEALLDRALPGRGHAFAVCPDARLAAHFARRPGEFALVLDIDRGAVSHAFRPPEDRRFQGHGAFDPSGRLLYATENDFDAGRGVVGVYDARMAASAPIPIIRGRSSTCRPWNPLSASSTARQATCANSRVSPPTSAS